MICSHWYCILLELQYMIAAVFCYLVYFTAYASCCSLSCSLSVSFFLSFCFIVYFCEVEYLLLFCWYKPSASWALCFSGGLPLHDICLQFDRKIWQINWLWWCHHRTFQSLLLLTLIVAHTWFLFCTYNVDI